ARSREQTIDSRRRKPARPEGTAGEALAPSAALAEETTVRDAPHGRPRAASTGLELVNDHHRHLLSTRSMATSGKKTLSPQNRQRKCSSPVDAIYLIRLKGCS